MKNKHASNGSYTPRRPRSSVKKKVPAPRLGYLVVPSFSKLKGDKKISTGLRRSFDPAKLTKDELRLLGPGWTDLVHYDAKEKVVKYGKSNPKQGCFSLSRAIPASLGLYRTLCLFPSASVISGDPWGSPWAIALRHTATALPLVITERKGALCILTVLDDVDAPPLSFKKGTLRVLSALVDERCPHPSGHVAGGVA